MSKLFQIYENDLVALEEILPQISERIVLLNCNDQQLRESLFMVKEILSNVRWNYGPPSEIEIP